MKHRALTLFALGGALLLAAGCSSSGGTSTGTGGVPGSGGQSATGGAGTGGRAAGSGGTVAGSGGRAEPGGGGATPTTTGGAGGGDTGIGGNSGGTGGLSIDAGIATDAAAVTGGRGGAAGTAVGGRAGTGSGGAGGGGGSGPANLKAAMVVQGAGTATAGDRVMLARLTARGFQVTLFSDAAVTAAAVAQMGLIVISSSAESGPLGTKLRDVAVPILCVENGEYPLMGMTTTTLNTDYGMDAGQNQVRITATAGSAAAELVGGLSGAFTIASQASDLGWGIPGPAALRAAVAGGNANHVVIFGYPKGAEMVGLTAPARRGAFAIRETLAANLSADGIKLFDAILTWVLGG